MTPNDFKGGKLGGKSVSPTTNEKHEEGSLVWFQKMLIGSLKWLKEGARIGGRLGDHLHRVKGRTKCGSRKEGFLGTVGGKITMMRKKKKRGKEANDRT